MVIKQVVHLLYLVPDTLHSFCPNSTGCRVSRPVNAHFQYISTWSSSVSSLCPVSFISPVTVRLLTTTQRRLRLAEIHMLLISRMHTNFCNQSLGAAGPRVWNCLLTDLRQTDLSYSRLREPPKTFSFGQWTKA